MKNEAEKPVLCTVLSDVNSTRRVLLSEVMRAGLVVPQNTSESELTLFFITTLSYSQSCYKSQSAGE